MYRVLIDEGYLQRVRIYNLGEMNCQREATDPEVELQRTQVGEHLFLDRQYNFSKTSGHSNFEEDFVLSEHSKITSINLFGGDMITYCQLPDFYEFRVL